MSQNPNSAVAVIGIDIGKNSFHVVGPDTCVRCGATSGRQLRSCEGGMETHQATTPRNNTIAARDIRGCRDRKRAQAAKAAKAPSNTAVRRLVISDVLSVRRPFPVCPQFQTSCCPAANDVHRGSDGDSAVSGPSLRSLRSRPRVARHCSAVKAGGRSH
jgi:hypothetical protein